jgi:hypothetical protein
MTRKDKNLGDIIKAPAYDISLFVYPSPKLKESESHDEKRVEYIDPSGRQMVRNGRPG